MVDAVGWLSSAILLATLAKQVHKEWRERTTRGVSRWLFVGQTSASLGFVAYSWLVHNWVFVVTNALILVNALIGAGVTARLRRGEQRRAGASGGNPSASAAPPGPPGRPRAGVRAES